MTNIHARDHNGKFAAPAKKSIDEKIRDRIVVDQTTGCHLWTGRRDRYGYGQLSANGRTRSAHRVAYELSKGPVPDGLVIDHLCRVRHCVNPDHMEPVTNGENVRRGALTGRRPSHCKNGHEYTAVNTTTDYRGNRLCRECDRAKGRAYHERIRSDPEKHEEMKRRWRERKKKVRDHAT